MAKMLLWGSQRMCILLDSLWGGIYSQSSAGSAARRVMAFLLQEPSHDSSSGDGRRCYMDTPALDRRRLGGRLETGAYMKQILSRCGYRCDLCLAYRLNVEANPSNQQVLSDGWHKYFGFRIPAEQISCEGCMADNPRLIDKSCPVRPCVIQRGIANCSECPDYVCDKLNDRVVVYETLASKHPCPIPADDRARFIAPYENKARFDLLRSARGTRKHEESDS